MLNTVQLKKFWKIFDIYSSQLNCIPNRFSPLNKRDTNYIHIQPYNMPTLFILLLGTSFVSYVSAQTNCSTITNNEACFFNTACTWLPQVPPSGRCGEIGVCADDCGACGTQTDCLNNGAGGINPDPKSGSPTPVSACFWTGTQCIGAICDTNCEECLLTPAPEDNCDDSFAPPGGCEYVTTGGGEDWYETTNTHSSSYTNTN